MFAMPRLVNAYTKFLHFSMGLLFLLFENPALWRNSARTEARTGAGAVVVLLFLQAAVVLMFKSQGGLRTDDALWMVAPHPVAQPDSLDKWSWIDDLDCP
jgi:hypothetical protein